jgi:hypothetical protein
MLLVGFTLPVVNTEGAEDVSNLMADKGLTTVTDEFQRGTMLDDVLFQCVDKLFICINAIDISDLSVNYNKNNSS